MKKRSVLIAAQNLCVGGVQTSLVNLLKNMAKTDEYDIDLFVFGRGEFLTEVPEMVKVIYGNRLLSLAATPFKEVVERGGNIDLALRMFLMILVRLAGSDRLYRWFFKKQRIKKTYDAAVSYFNDVPNNYFNRGTNLFVSEFADAKEKTAWIHNDPIKMGFDRDECIETYRSFDRIVCVSKAVKKKFDQLLPEYADKTEVVYNTFVPEEIIEKANLYDPGVNKNLYNIVTVCRVDNIQKRTDKIIDVCVRLKSEGITNFCWRIIGGGPDIDRDKKHAAMDGVGDLVIFEGEKSNPYPYIRSSDLFALYSAYEGYPMVVGEAMIIGVPILTSGYAAAHEQIPETKGQIAEDDDDFYIKLKELISSKKTCI